MATVQIAYWNAMQLGTVAATSAATNYPALRLYDFELGKMWKATSAVAQTITLTGNAQSINTLLIPDGHNLAGATVNWQYYSGSWTDVSGSPFTATSGLIRKAISAARSDASWRLVITPTTMIPQMPECYMTYLYSFEVQPQYGLTSVDKRNALKIDAVSGRSTYLRLGKSKRYLEYSIYAFDDTDLARLNNLEYHLGLAIPFFIIDHDGNEFFAELVNELDITTFNANSSKYFYSTNLQIQQVF
jgi:hypothetical protein